MLGHWSRLMDEVSNGELIRALGPGWIACNDALPWNDFWSRLEYIVYSPPYGGELHLCNFNLNGPVV